MNEAKRKGGATPGFASPRGQKGGERQLSGWATLRKAGRNLVSSRIRLDPWVRQQATLLWKLQTLNDRLQLDLQTEAALLDPTGVGFAFGGVNPGHIHSKGQAVAAHKVHYSVDRVGRYLLHVRLRQQARPLPGSPFGLVVEAGKAHYAATALEPKTQPLRGEVGMEPDDGVTMVLQAHDRVGNRCTVGGADFRVVCAREGVESSCVDQGDGTYVLSWKSRTRGGFEAKVLIGSEPVRGSPVHIELHSTIAEVSRTELDGPGLKTAVAGTPAPVELLFIDQFGNPTTPSADWTVGVAINNDGRARVRLAEIALHSSFEGRWLDHTSGRYEVRYTASMAGHRELHLWWARTEQPTERQALPGSPFTIHVLAGEPFATNTMLEGWSVLSQSSKKEGKKQTSSPPAAQVSPSGTSAAATADNAREMVAGDLVTVRILGVDKFENAAQLKESSIDATVVGPDGGEAPLLVYEARQKEKGREKTQFEVRYEAAMSGMHELQVRLQGEPIQGSPITFNVLAAAASVAQSELVTPDLSEGHCVAGSEVPVTARILTRDKYGNACAMGGLRIQGRLQLVKASANDLTILMPNNHTVTIEDNDDGTYAVLVTVMMPCTVKLIVNMDKDMPGSSGELPPLQLTFAKGRTVEVVEEEDAPAPAVAVS
jgi:hypothetical protein